MRYLSNQDRLLGQALNELRHPYLRVAGYSLLTLALGAALVGAQALAPLASESLALAGSGAELTLADATQPTSLAAWFTGLLLVIAAFGCHLLSRFDRRSLRRSSAWRWGVWAFLGLAAAQTTPLAALFGDLLESGRLGLALDAQFFGPLAFLTAFGGFFALSIWRQRRSGALAFLTLLGYGAWALSYTYMHIPGFAPDPQWLPLLAPGLRLAGSSLLLWGLYGHLVHSSRFVAPTLSLRRRLRYAA